MSRCTDCPNCLDSATLGEAGAGRGVGCALFFRAKQYYGAGQIIRKRSRPSAENHQPQAIACWASGVRVAAACVCPAIHNISRHPGTTFVLEIVGSLWPAFLPVGVATQEAAATAVEMSSARPPAPAACASFTGRACRRSVPGSRAARRFNLGHPGSDRHIRRSRWPGGHASPFRPASLKVTYWPVIQPSKLPAPQGFLDVPFRRRLANSFPTNARSRYTEA